MATLTDTKARNLKPEEKPLPHGGVTGLALHPSTIKGKGKWVLRYVSPITGKRRNAGLGSYPEVSVADAGNQARLLREQLSKGLDPLEMKKEEATKPTIPTVEIAARQVHQQLLPGWRNPKHGKQWISTLEQYAFPVIGQQPIDSITPAQIARVLQPIWLTIPETATRVKQRLHAVMAWAWANGFCPANPVDVVDKLLPQQPSKTIRTQHQPAMDWRLLPEFYQEHLANSARFDVSRALLSFVILTACRSGEARNMRWEELDLNTAIWTIPADRMKTQVTHRVPLSLQAITVLKKVAGLHSEWVFPSPRKQIPLTDMAMTSLLRRLDAQSTTPGRVATAHGFRSSFRDWCSEQGYARDLAERALAHTVQNKVEAAYHRTDLLDQRRPMMDAWAEFMAGDLPTK
ncbi:tyrosine-type recombinase/integrase [Aeromonas dhakensis]|uniref:tyrosine-type recombinase/integrase n=1 Tax=Aeromonas dhakensis TaxID=196024 RepID=UPI003B9E00AC